ncbi:hypothetical protein [Streptococcus oricebi]|uniref:Uncharacterized protein n=1 Tax=Streptococcus oricebi TaxID=1547447 RepID=A0ABS5B696_9STRE|nr:hypothetical protein [Streptococcus oricebi]MBP2623494.1 hypothetical protein [Streptococcus oricebi]
MDVIDTIGDVLQGKKDLKEIKKDLEKAAIKAFCAPPIKAERKKIEADYDKQISITAATTKTAITTLSYQMNEKIKGKGQTAIDETIDKHSKDFDSI